MMGNNQNLFFSPEEKGREFSDVLKEVQEYISSKYSTLMVEGGNEEVKQQVKRYISKYIADYRITVKGKTREELINDLYTEMAEFSFLTKYIFGTGIEEIDINSWKDIEVQYSDGRCEKMEEHFESPEHAINVIRRMLHVSGMVLDNASPAVRCMMGNNQNLFFSPEEKGREFSDVLKEVQEYISSKYSTLMVEGGNEEVKQQVKRYISKYIADYRITVKGKTREELINDLYTEMAEFSFLTKYIFGTGIEEIDINSWKDIEVQYSDGRCEKMEEHFESPEHAINVIRRMLHVSGMVLDNASPAVLGHLSKNIRIAVLKTPLVDEDVGIAASIRIVNPQSLKKSDFVDGGTATDEMLDFLAECLRYGISICVAGATSSGKTTLAGWLLTTIPDNKRIFTIENGSRELALVREKDGKVTNSVIHTLTRYSENEKQNIDQDMLLDMALRFNPEIICVGEMRSSEAYTAQESARTGHTVLTTIHSNSCESTYSRMRTLCKRKYDMDDEVLMDLVTEAFPIVVFTKQLENKKRRLMEIMECEITPDGKRHFNSLFRYEITENRVEGDKFIINGTHKKVCGISESLKKRFLENGMPREVLNKITGGGASVC